MKSTKEAWYRDNLYINGLKQYNIDMRLISTLIVCLLCFLFVLVLIFFKIKFTNLYILNCELKIKFDILYFVTY